MEVINTILVYSKDYYFSLLDLFAKFGQDYNIYNEA